MPLYDYECPKCSAIKEVQHSVSEIGKIAVLCDDCKKPMKKMLSLPALIGFDNVGRSLSRKERTEAPKKESSNKESSNKESSNKEASKTETSEKSTTPKTESKKDTKANH